MVPKNATAIRVHENIIDLEEEVTSLPADAK